MAKIYWLIVALITYLGLSFGWIMPFLYSAKSNELVWAGYIYTIFIPVVLFYFGKAFYRVIKKNK